MHENIEIKDALNYIEKNKIDYFALGNKRGVIGALAAVGMELHDHTYELIAYRERSRFGKKREIDVKSVIEMDKMDEGFTLKDLGYVEKGITILAVRRGDEWYIMPPYSSFRVKEGDILIVKYSMESKELIDELEKEEDREEIIEEIQEEEWRE